MRVRCAIFVALMVLLLMISLCIKQSPITNSGRENEVSAGKKGNIVRDGQENVSKSYNPKFVEVPSLKEVYKDYFKIGAAVDYDNIEKYGEILLKHFNSIIPGNSMKPESTQPREGKFVFDHADEVVNFAIENNYGYKCVILGRWRKGYGA